MRGLRWTGTLCKRQHLWLFPHLKLNDFALTQALPSCVDIHVSLQLHKHTSSIFISVIANSSGRVNTRSIRTSRQWSPVEQGVFACQFLLRFCFLLIIQNNDTRAQTSVHLHNEIEWNHLGFVTVQICAPVFQFYTPYCHGLMKGCWKCYLICALFY